MSSGSARFKLEHVAVGLGALLVVAVVVANINIGNRVGVVGGDLIRWMVALAGVATLSALIRMIARLDRPKRDYHYFLLVWLVGLLTISGLVQSLPGAPALETLQSMGLATLDPFAQATVQWSAAWSAVVLLLLVFGGPHLNLGWGIVVWLLGVFATCVVAGTLPEDAVPTLVVLPIAATWAAVIFIGIVYGAPGPDSGPTDASQTAAPAGLPVTRAVWASLALVMLGLSLAEFESFVALDQQVNRPYHTQTQKAMDVVASRVDNIDQQITATARALRTGGDVKDSLDSLQVAIADESDQVTLAVESQQLNPIADKQQADQTSQAVQRVQRSNEDLQALMLPLGTLNPDVDHDVLASVLSRDLPRAVAAVRREVSLAQQSLDGNELLPTAGVFSWVAAVYAALVLLPWVLFVLFLLQKRESRARESLIDLCLLDGHAAPPRAADADFGPIQPGSLLDRVLGEGFLSRRPASTVGPTVGQVQSALVERAFSEPEYLIGLMLLSSVVAAGWYMVFYPGGGTALANIISQGADAAHLWTYLLSGLNPLTAAFAGAYFWCVYALVRRYLDSDLYPAAFLQCAVQFVLALVLALMIAIAVPPVAQFATSVVGLVGDTASGLGARVGAAPAPTTTPVPVPTPTAPASAAATSGTASTSTAPVTPAPTTVEALTMLLAFVGGVSISAGFTQVLSLLRVLLQFVGLRSDQPLMDQPKLTELEGIDSWTEARFAEEGVDNIQALANAPLQRLVLRTHFTTRRLVDWVDQALLYVHTGNWPTKSVDAAITRDDTSSVPAGSKSESDARPAQSGRIDLFRALRFAGIRTATDLLSAGGWLKMAAFVDLGDAVQRQQTLQLALGRVLPQDDASFSAAIFTTCQALIESPNWVYVANYRRASREMLGADTREWIQAVNPPTPTTVMEPFGSHNGVEHSETPPAPAPPVPHAAPPVPSVATTAPPAAPAPAASPPPPASAPAG